MKKVAIAKLTELEDRKPAYAISGEVDLVVVRIDEDVSVFYGRCLHRGALMSDGFVRGKNVQVGDFPERDIMDELESSDEQDEL